MSRTDINQWYNTIDFAIYPGSDGKVRVYESGFDRGVAVNYFTGDTLRVAVESGVVKYYRNGGLLYTSAIAPLFPLFADTSFYSAGATITNAVISGTVANGPVDSSVPLSIFYSSVPNLFNGFFTQPDAQSCQWMDCRQRQIPFGPP